MKLFYEPFVNMTHRIELFTMTQRIDFYNDSKNSIFEKSWLEPFYWKTQRIEPFLPVFETQRWTMCLKELNLFHEYDALPVFERDSKIWTFFSMCLKELNLSFCGYDSKVFSTPKKRRTELNLSFLNMTTKKLNLFSVLNFLQKWFTDLNPSFPHDSKNWTLFWQIADSKY